MGCVSEKSCAKVAQHRWSNLLWFLYLPRDVDGPPVSFFPRAGVTQFGLFELYKSRIILKSKHDVVGFDVYEYRRVSSSAGVGRGELREITCVNVAALIV